MAKNRFVVDLGGVELSEKSVQQIEASVQKAALNALADIDFLGDLVARFPRDWQGIWINRGDGLNINDKEILEFAGR